MKKVLRWIQYNHPNLARANYEIFEDDGNSLGGRDFELTKEQAEKLEAVYKEIAQASGYDIEVPKKEV